MFQWLNRVLTKKVGKMINKDAKILVAVSGGVDSVYMLHMLLEQGYTNLGVVHVNHQLRESAEDDNDLVFRLSLENDLLYHYHSANIEHIALQGKESIELTARKVRRSFFAGLMINHEYDWLALGHHADDQAETVLLNLLRGSGVHGLAGMLGVDKEQKIFRPLIAMSKEVIYKAANEAKLAWNEDHTNRESEYDRNWLRNVIIPQLEERRSGVKKVLNDTALRMQSMSEYININAQKWVLGLFINNACRLDVSHFMSEHKVLRAEILGLIWVYYNGSRKDFNNKVVFEVEKWLSSNPEGGTEVYFGKQKLTIKRGLVGVRDNV